VCRLVESDHNPHLIVVLEPEFAGALSRQFGVSRQRGVVRIDLAHVDFPARA
jgi:hypothetical protein